MSPNGINLADLMRGQQQSEKQPEATQHSTRYEGSFDLTITTTKLPLKVEYVSETEIAAPKTKASSVNDK